MVSDKRFAHFFPPDFGAKIADRRPGGRATWYICKQCRRAFPRFMVDDASWKASGFRVGAVCKHCLEESVPNPKYQTLDEYVANTSKIGKRLVKDFPGWNEAQTKAFKVGLLDTWDKEEEPIPPERTAKELEAMLSKGECTIAYANAPSDVRAMCRLCINETCPGPYLYGNWEEREGTSNEVERAMKRAQETKPKHLKISK